MYYFSSSNYLNLVMFIFYNTKQTASFILGTLRFWSIYRSSISLVGSLCPDEKEKGEGDRGNFGKCKQGAKRYHKKAQKREKGL